MLTNYIGNRLPRPTRWNPKPTSRNLCLQQRLHRRCIIQHLRRNRRRIHIWWSILLRFILAGTSRKSLCPVGVEDLCRDCVDHDAEFGIDDDGMISGDGFEMDVGLTMGIDHHSDGKCSHWWDGCVDSAEVLGRVDEEACFEYVSHS